MKIFNLICHRKPDRSFFIKNHQFPVCARCTGFYTSLIIYIILDLFYKLNVNLNLYILGFILLIPCAIDGLTQYFGYRESTNLLRFITGIIGGVGLILILEFSLQMLI